MSKTALICGSYAFDSIMVFHDSPTVAIGTEFAPSKCRL
jgi:hypothetical protein